MFNYGCDRFWNIDIMIHSNQFSRYPVSSFPRFLSLLSFRFQPNQVCHCACLRVLRSQLYFGDDPIWKARSMTKIRNFWFFQKCFRTSRNVHWHSFDINQKRFQQFQLILHCNNSKWHSPWSNKSGLVTLRDVTKNLRFHPI